VILPSENPVPGALFCIFSKKNPAMREPAIPPQ
jgi:hypothetical protein